MQRIGIAASKMAQGNLFFYNMYVVFLSFFFSLFIFVISAAVVLLALIIISYLGRELMAFEFFQESKMILKVSLISLAITTGIFNLLAIYKNIRLRHTP